ncbi:uncharacterized protein LOC107478917 [Arachis duranensis]|uniref:Uncharacterized protein LOC107478917 n=1 Tax=Arachis duranensis TaxID=130453 RepID=A0A6P4CQ48_ARADU|nr:uncharacterized protein LOC107478917 [Arachis duranensis]
MYRSMDYHTHITNVRRSPSILSDVPRYPNAHLAFKKTVSEEDDVVEGSYGRRHHHDDFPETHERVDVIEKVDDQCYPAPKRGFELQKWKTFRP